MRGSQLPYRIGPTDEVQRRGNPRHEKKLTIKNSLFGVNEGRGIVEFGLKTNYVLFEWPLESATLVT